MPIIRGTARRPYWQRLINLIAGLLSLAVLLVSMGGFVVVTWFNSSVSRVHLAIDPNRPAAAPEGSENWLLVGTDNGRADVPGTRSDTTILTHLDADGTTTNVSFPRDTLVTIPEYTVKGVNYPAHKAKFNEAILDGGPVLLERTVQALTQIRVDHYVSVDLAGFKQISQALNGVRVCIKPEPASNYEDNGALTNINDGYSGFHGTYGDQTVVGDQALAFVRQRHGLPGGDIARIKRQQQFLGSVFRQAANSNVLFNPVRLTKLLAAIHRSLILDDGTSLTDLEKLGLRLRGVDPSKISFETIPQRPLAATDTDLGDVSLDAQGLLELTPTGQKSVGNVQILDQAGFKVMIDKLKGAAAAPAPGATAAPASSPQPVTVTASQVSVAVQDGTGSIGLSNSVTNALAHDGFHTGIPGPADSTTYARSEVRYAPGDKASAETVAAAIPGSVVKEDPSVSTGIVLIIGANYTTVDPVSLSADSPTAAPTVAPTAPAPSTSPSVPASTAVTAAANNRCTY